MARGNFGERLKRERELREVTLDEITQGTRIGPRFLEAMENEEWDKLPGGVFNRGFVRSVARYLGLDEEAFLAEYDLAHGPHAQAIPVKPEQRIPSPPAWMRVGMVLGALLLIAGLVWGGIYGWKKYRERRAQAVQAAPAALQLPASAPVAGATPGDAAAAPTVGAGSELTTRPLELTVAVSAVTHVKVEADGATLADEEARPGDTRKFQARSQFVVTAGDSSAVLLELNGEAMPPIGPPGASGTITLTNRNLRQEPRQGPANGNTQP